jgi:hypothetical protein
MEAQHGGSDAPQDLAEDSSSRSTSDDIAAGVSTEHVQSAGAGGRSLFLSEQAWLGAAHIESPCCLRCGRHTRLKLPWPSLSTATAPSIHFLLLR